MLDQAFGLLINEIALDIGSAHIRVYSKAGKRMLKNQLL
jgi:hypothetical protein